MGPLGDTEWGDMYSEARAMTGESQAKINPSLNNFMSCKQHNMDRTLIH